MPCLHCSIIFCMLLVNCPKGQGMAVAHSLVDRANSSEYTAVYLQLSSGGLSRMLRQNNETCNTKNSTEKTSRRSAGTACTVPVACFELRAANRHPTRREFWFDADSSEHHHTDSTEWYRFVLFRSSVGSHHRSYCVADTSA